jgi:hypothetical protein
MFKEISIMDEGNDTEFTFAAWTEVAGILEITVKDLSCSGVSSVQVISVMDKKMWDEFKRAGDIVFDMMEDL